MIKYLIRQLASLFIFLAFVLVSIGTILVVGATDLPDKYQQVVCIVLLMLECFGFITLLVKLELTGSGK
ncbi:hypothetical protein VP150E351_P0095 [Vibrio phage 150E35-1]|nr:hypothetical protein VP150E351_P0095 [Vibrio phage 150E35-1]